jgi:threonine dehydrogenase-like Zn-dependent dehydrogenase
MTVTFSGTTVPIAQSEDFEPVLIVNETVVEDGKTSIQASTEYGRRYAFHCVGTSTQKDALLSLIGSAGTLVINGSSDSNYFIKAIGPFAKIPMTNYFSFDIRFVKDTTL